MMDKKTFEKPTLYVSAFLQEDVLTVSTIEKYDNTGTDIGNWGNTSIFDK